MSKIMVLDRIEDLEHSTNSTMVEMLSRYASEYLDCDDCLIKRKCQLMNRKCQFKNERMSCVEMWDNYLRG